MTQAVAAFSSSDHIALEVSLNRMVSDALGAMATLPLACLGELPTPDPEAMILGRYDVWHSCLILVRELAKTTDAVAPANVEGSLAALDADLRALRDAFVALASTTPASPKMARTAYKELTKAYEGIVLHAGDLAAALHLEVQTLAQPRGLKRAAFERSLRWLDEELRARESAATAAS